MKRTILLLLTVAVIASVTAATYRPWTDAQHTAHEIAELARGMGLDEDHPIITEAQRLWALDTEDARILAAVIYGEARYCPDRHQQLVAQVVLNRVADERFPDTVRGVVEQPGQYTPAYTRNLPSYASADAEMQRCFEAALAALEGRVECPADVIYQSQCQSLGAGVYEISEVDTGWYASTTYFAYG